MSVKIKSNSCSVFKNLTFFKKYVSGKNNQGKITVRFRGGGHRRRYRFINFNIGFLNEECLVCRLEYDPNRSAKIALVLFKTGMFAYILAPNGIKVGDCLNSTKNKLQVGNSLPLYLIPNGSLIYNIEKYPGRGAIFTRSAGAYSILLNKFAYDNQNVLIKLTSNEEYLVNAYCWAMIGVVSNVGFYKNNLYKAGQVRWLGRRPHVRGVAMNPVDHPHGGGEGKTSGGRPSVTPKGKITKGKPTRSLRKSNRFIYKRRKKNN